MANYYSPMESPEASDDEGGRDDAYPAVGVRIPKLYKKKKGYTEKVCSNYWLVPLKFVISNKNTFPIFRCVCEAKTILNSVTQPVLYFCFFIT